MKSNIWRLVILLILFLEGNLIALITYLPSFEDHENNQKEDEQRPKTNYKSNRYGLLTIEIENGGKVWKNAAFSIIYEVFWLFTIWCLPPDIFSFPIC